MARRRRQPAPIEHSILLTATLCLLAAGAVMVFSASSARSVLQGQGDGTALLLKYLMYGGIGLVGMYVLSRRGLDALPRLTGPFLGLCFLLLLATRIPGLGVEVNGARRWLGAGPVQFQPSELMKLALILYAVKLLSERPQRVRHPRDLVPLGVMGGAACGLVALQPDLGTALVMAGTLGCILVAAGMPIRHLTAVGGVGTLLVTIYAFSAPYRRERLFTFLDKWEHVNDAGFQSVQGEIALGSGGLFGRGLGESMQKNLFLPEAHTDFILAIVGEELGVVGIFALLFLYGLVAYAGLRVARSARGRYAKLLAAGLTSLFLCQAALNIFTVLGLAPLTGVPLPFISYGSTNLIVLLAAMGLLLSVADGGGPRLRVVTGRDAAGSGPRGRTDDRHRSRGDGGARRAGTGGRRRAAG